MKRKPVLFALVLFASVLLQGGEMQEGEKLFKAYCWGCHHPTAEAFGPSFQTIASKRNQGEIIAMIADPEATAKRLGYSRNSMPAFDDLSAKEMETLADYILSFKENKQ